MSLSGLLCHTNAHTVDFEAVPGGVAELTPAEIAAYLVGASEGAYYTGMAYYAGQPYINEITRTIFNNDLPGLYRFYRMDAWERGRAKARGEGGFLWELVRMAVCESIDPCVCLACSGTRYIDNKPCNSCLGGGRRYPHPDQKAHILDITLKRWRYWNDLYEAIISVISHYRCDAAQRISEHLRDERETS